MTEWILNIIQSWGYAGIVLLMVLENVFPPIPSELIMPFAGFVAARGSLDPVGVIAAGVLGSLLGALPWYWAGRSFSHDRLRRLAARHGRWLTVDPEDLDMAQEWFRRHGSQSVFFGRLVPAVRSVISMPAGMARMPMASFLLWSALGSLLWVCLLTGLGFILEHQYTRVEGYVEIVTRFVVGALVATYLWRVATFGRAKRKRQA